MIFSTSTTCLSHDLRKRQTLISQEDGEFHVQRLVAVDELVFKETANLVPASTKPIEKRVVVAYGSAKGVNSVFQRVGHTKNVCFPSRHQDHLRIRA